MNRIVFSNILIALRSSFELPVTSQFDAQDLIPYHLLNLFAYLSSAIDVAVVARVVARLADSGPLKAPSIFDFTAHGATLCFNFLNSKG